MPNNPSWPQEQPSLAYRIYIKKSWKAAITAFCIECLGGSRTEAKNCTHYLCPLYSFSPAYSVPANRIAHDAARIDDPTLNALMAPLRKNAANLGENLGKGFAKPPNSPDL